MHKSVKLLLTESVDNLGIVGDVVTVRLGYARNYLLPRNMATEPSQEAIAAVATKRAQAERLVAERRSQQEKMIERLAGHEITLQRSCNDLGHLYGSVTQKDISDLLKADGFDIPPRAVRMGQAIKRVDSYEVHIKLDSDLAADIKVWVVPDRELKVEDRQEMDFDEEGNLIEPGSKPRGRRGRRSEEGVDAIAGVDEAPADEKPRRKRDKAGA